MADTHILPGGKKKYFCDLCDKDFDTIQDAVTHEKLCTSVRGRNYADWTVHQLKWTLKGKGLPVSGKKHALIERLESSEGLGGSEQLSCDFCGKKFKSKNKLFDHLKKFPGHSSEEKNYLGEGALDAKDKYIVEQIREKYRAPSYKTRSKREKPSYPLKLSIAIIVLCFIGICCAYFFQMEFGIERQGGNSDNYTVGCFTSFLLFGILFQSVYNQNKEMALTSQDTPPIVNFLTAIGVLGFLLAIYLNFFDGNLDKVDTFWDRVTCCSSLILLIIPLALFYTESTDEKLKNDEQMEKIWEDAQKHEERSQFDAATGIWSKLGEEGEVERVTRLKTEYLCVILKGKIKNLIKKGVNCKQLKKQLETIEAALEVSAARLEFVGIEDEEETLTVADSTVTSSPDINLKKKTDISLEEIEEEPHTLASDMTEVDNDSVISKSNAGADEDDKFMKLKELTEMKKKGLIDDDDYEKMKREIIG